MKKLGNVQAMAHAEKVRRLQAQLKAQGESISLAAPPLWRLAWRLGWKWTPPLFLGFWTNVLILGGFWGLCMLGIAWAGLPYISRPLDWRNVVVMLLGSVCFGLPMAGLLRSRFKRLRLPVWTNY